MDCAIMCGDVGSVRELVGSEPRVVNYNLRGTPLHRAVMECEEDEIVNVILGVPGINLRVQDVDGDTAFHLAIGQRRVDIARRMVGMDSGVIDIPDNEGNYPLHTACENASTLAIFFDYTCRERTKRMLEVGDRGGYTPLELACRYRTKLGIILLLRNGARMTNNRMYRERVVKYIRLYKMINRIKIDRVKRKLF